MIKTYTRKDLVAKAKEARKEAMAAIGRARAAYPDCYPVHRGIEISLSVNSSKLDEGVFLELKELSGKGLAKGIEWLSKDIETLDPADEIEIWISGGIDLYESLTNLINGWDYDPWVEDWEIEL
jgi:hypothetical protein